MDFSEKLRACRKARALSQPQAAKLAGIAYAQWQRYESGKTSPGLQALANLARALNCSIIITPEGPTFLSPTLNP